VGLTWKRRRTSSSSTPWTSGVYIDVRTSWFCTWNWNVRRRALSCT